ncbi:MAG: NAD(P)H-dependent oxidoreductase subunit E [Bacteroidales bacterium]|nr:NAD(P)H-dependent oxidoreductase subunit E [Bacteroidales bacterium]
MGQTVQNVTGKYQNDKSRLMDILLDIQAESGHVSKDMIKDIASQLKISTVDVEQTLSFYHFFNSKPSGKYSIYLNDSAVANMMGRAKIAKAFEEEIGISFGKVTADGTIGLFNTACIGMNDQEPAAIINGKVFTSLTTDKVKTIVKAMKEGKSVDQMVTSFGDGKNADALVKAMVNNNIEMKGAVLFSDYEEGAGIKKAVSVAPGDVVFEVIDSNIRGRGGAGFPTGMKWGFCRRAKGDKTAYLVCNADEGEPGTFKERAILTEIPGLLFEGMIIAGYALEAKEGILYLRYEYKYLKDYLEKVLQDFRNKNLLGKNIAGKQGFDFDIRIQLGAGAYICGEESALIESAEGKRGEPRNRPPFPVQKGYMQMPTVVNNVETLCSVAKIMVKGSGWFKSIGTHESAGTKLLSISGDCEKPGVYEVAWGISIADLLEMVGAKDVQAVQVGGPSGMLVAPKDFKRRICYEDVPTGGSIIIIGNNRNLLEIVANFTDFFIEESCGSCAPCRNLTPVLKFKLEKIMRGKGIASDIDDLVKWGSMMKKANRCGLGQTCANPILTSIEHFRNVYEVLVKQEEYISEFDMSAAVAESCEAVGRTPKI